MRSLEKLKKKKISNETFFAFVFIEIALIVWIFILILNNAAISDWILSFTFLALLWYAWETKRIREIEQEPIFIMYIRNINDYSKDKDRQEKQREYCIKTATGNLAKEFDKYSGEGLNCVKEFDKYLIRIRNVGKGPAFNVEVRDENLNFKIEKYQSQFFAPEPKGDEQSIKIIKKDGDAIKGDYSEFKKAVFEISCENTNKKEYKFRYKIVDIEKQEIKYLG